MKRNISNKLTLIALLTLFGCTAKKQLVVVHKPDTLVKAADTTKTTNIAGVKPEVMHLTAQQLSAIQSTQVNFMTFSAKAKVKMNIDGSSNDVTMNIRIKKNQMIWISITAVLGLEGARVLVTPDSIKIINRVDATYLKKPFSYVNQYAGNQVTYQALEALVMGNTWPGLVTDTTAVENNSAGQALTGTLEDLVYKLVFGPDMRLATTTMYSRGIVARNLEVDNNGAIKVADRILPAQININATSIKSKINISLTYTKADFNTNPEFPFTVPARYSVVN